MTLGSSVGETLRQLRIQKGVALAEIAAEIKIRVRLLQAIEAEDFDQLPGGVFRKSFVLQYARALGADTAEITEKLNLLAAFQEQPAVPEREEARHVLEMPPIVGERDWSSLRASFGSFLAVLGVIVACTTLYYLYVSEHPARTSPPRPIATIPSVPQAVPAESQSAPQAQAVGQQQAPAPAPAEHSAAAPIQLAAAVVPVRVGLLAEELTWVQATSEGKRVFSDALQANQSKTIEASGPIRLLIGNAGGVKIQLNGKEIPQVGPRGQVRVVELRPDGYEIVPLKPLTPEPL
ncbi:MAG: helix-turn-helix domain-containing protein [Bryobacteraceae bacterium]